MTSAIAFFEARLRWQTDPADLAAARMAGTHSGLVLDVRDDAAWAQGHIPGAVHVPLSLLGERIGAVVPDLDTGIVVYCWGPGCNGSTKAALALAKLGYREVRELVGGFEYWAREGLAIESVTGRSRRDVDDLTGARPGRG
ncbi:MAG: rhodanese-like domain-containing protein [Mycobacterium sp.]